MPATFKVILPKKFLTKPFIEEPKKILTEWNGLVHTDFLSNIRTFKRVKVKFTRIKANVIKDKAIHSSVLTDNLIYFWINRGTKKNYPITPKRAKALRFRSGFKSKTTPLKRIPGREGGSFGPFVFRQIVIHPGIFARHIDRRIARKQNPKLIKKLKLAYKNAAKASNHSYK